MNEEQKGVGPHKEPWPAGPQYDPELLMHGDHRNVEDKYRYMTVEAIKAEISRLSDIIKAIKADKS